MSEKKLYHFDPNNYIKTVYDYCLNKAKLDKDWAIAKEKELGGRLWKEACKISQDMLNEYLDTPVEQLAIQHYKYLRLRSHSFDCFFNFPIDRPAFDLWTRLTGEEPKKNL